MLKVESRPIFSQKCDPRLPPIWIILAKHKRTMKINEDKYLKRCFSKTALAAFRRQNKWINLKETWKIEREKINCESFYIIYLIICKKCNKNTLEELDDS